jgi:hypothetical protein
MQKTLGILALLAAFAAGPALADGGPSLHGFGDFSFKNDYITPRGLRVTSDGATFQALNGLVIDVPQNPQGTLKDVSFVLGTWTDFNPGYTLPNTQAFNEFDWFIGTNFKLGKRWSVGLQYVEFISPQKAFKTEQNLETTVSFDDSGLLPIKVSPYIKWFYALKGDSTVVTGKRGGTYDIELGAAPSFKPMPELTLSAPTWLTVGPQGFWGGENGNAGVLSTGLKASYALPAPPAMGHWSAWVGYQFYHLINDNLVLAESILNNGKTSRNLNLIQGGISYGF